MGIVNVTPDSFFDGGRFYAQDKAVERGFTLLKEGADILDIGGESTRPYADTTPLDEEMRRVVPVVEELSPYGFVSVDTRKAKVMEAALNAGAKMVNDVSGLTYDKHSFDTIKSAKCQVVLTHSQGDPGNMQNNPVYSNLEDEIFGYLISKKEECMAAGVREEDLYLDPGIGFGKSKKHNLWILHNLQILCSRGGTLLGASRKSFLAEDGDTPEDRLPQSLAVAAIAKNRNVSILRVHDVAETRRFLKTYGKLLT